MDVGEDYFYLPGACCRINSNFIFFKNVQRALALHVVGQPSGNLPSRGYTAPDCIQYHLSNCRLLATLQQNCRPLDYVQRENLL
jgi:hypothetical protein